MSQWYLPEKVFGAIHLSVVAFSFHFFEVRIVGTSTPQHVSQKTHRAVQKMLKLRPNLRGAGFNTRGMKPKNTLGGCRDSAVENHLSTT